MINGCHLETDNAATLTSNPPDLQKPGSVGRALGGMEIRVVDNTGRRLPTGQVGEILAKGPGLMKGYYKRPDLTAKAIVEAKGRRESEATSSNRRRRECLSCSCFE